MTLLMSPAEAADKFVSEFFEATKKYLIVQYIILVARQAILASVLSQAVGITPGSVVATSNENARCIRGPLSNVDISNADALAIVQS
jgi:hypothetical protein